MSTSRRALPAQYGCDPVRESLSAALDGEPGVLATDVVETHLAGCRDCTAWYDQVRLVDRRLRVRPAEQVPDLTERVLRAALAARRPTPFPALVARAGLVAVALAQLALALPVLLGMQGVSGASMHLAHESGAWNLGLAIAFATAAVRPKTASALLPTVGVLALTFLTITLRDLVGGAVTVERGLTHVLMVVGTALLATLVLLGRRPHRRTRPTSSTAAVRRGVTTH